MENECRLESIARAVTFRRDIRHSARRGFLFFDRRAEAARNREAQRRAAKPARRAARVARTRDGATRRPRGRARSAHEPPNQLYPWSTQYPPGYALVTNISTMCFGFL
ncbi:hypothetical protein Y048_5679 [Burkholderia pseudomallei MSHR456]|nr:hypothetical protein Y048_5679 [Burkholderia pseudomallei MSHR456]